MNAKMTKQKIIKVTGKNNKGACPTTVCAVDVKSMNRLTS
jgi:hypothetical protein